MRLELIDMVRVARRLNYLLDYRSAIATLLLASLIVSGCADNSEKQAMATRCQSDDRAACAKLDDERQVRDQADYQGEPALGYLTMPPGIFLPVPVAAHASDPSM